MATKASPSSSKIAKASDKKSLNDGDKLDPSNPDPTVIDMITLGQLLDMDDDEQHSFSKPLVEDYIEQANATLTEIESKLVDTSASIPDRLAFLSSKGHFLKGSSAALGVIKVRDSCEALQNLGKCKDETGLSDITQDKAYTTCEKLLPQLRKDHEYATRWLEVLLA